MTSQFDEIEYEDTFHGLPNDPKKRELIKKYVTEAVEHKKAKDKATLLEKDVYDSVKESEEALEISLKYFKAIVAYTYDAEKKAQVLSELEAAKEGAELLGLIAQ